MKQKEREKTPYRNKERKPAEQRWMVRGRQSEREPPRKRKREALAGRGRREGGRWENQAEPQKWRLVSLSELVCPVRMDCTFFKSQEVSG